MTAAELELTQGRPRRRRHLFRNARLNAVGWAALAAASLVSAAVAAGLGSLAGGRWWIGAIVGLPVVVLVLLALDRRLSYVGFGWTDDVVQVEEAAEQLRARGVDVHVQQDPPALNFRRRDQRVVAEVLGLPSDRFPWE